MVYLRKPRRRRYRKKTKPRWYKRLFNDLLHLNPELALQDIGNEIADEVHHYGGTFPRFGQDFPRLQQNYDKKRRKRYNETEREQWEAEHGGAHGGHKHWEEMLKHLREEEEIEMEHAQRTKRILQDRRSRRGAVYIKGKKLAQRSLYQVNARKKDIIYIPHRRAKQNRIKSFYN